MSTSSELGAPARTLVTGYLDEARQAFGEVPGWSGLAVLLLLDEEGFSTQCYLQVDGVWSTPQGLDDRGIGAGGWMARGDELEARWADELFGDAWDVLTGGGYRPTRIVVATTPDGEPTIDATDHPFWESGESPFQEMRDWEARLAATGSLAAAW